MRRVSKLRFTLESASFGRTDLFVLAGGPDAIDEPVQIVDYLEDPALVVALLERGVADLERVTSHGAGVSIALRVAHLGHDADAVADGGRLRLGAAHAAEARREEHPARQVVEAEVLPSRVQHGQLIERGGHNEASIHRHTSLTVVP